MRFKRAVQRYGQTPEPETPYQRAGQAWDERIGAARVQAKNWRLMAFGGLFLTAGLSSALIWQSMQSHVVPYVVEVDTLGEAQAVAPARVASIVDRVVADGADRVAFGDTTGMATPRRVTELVTAVRDRQPDIPMLLHFHNTRGTGLANILTALQLGVTEFDASIGGLGGCPYAPGATGNVATEEVVHMLHDMGIETGIDLDALVEVAALAQDIVGKELPSGVLRAGPRYRTIPA